jgi:hypothetical protein
MGALDVKRNYIGLSGDSKQVGLQENKGETMDSPGNE